MSNSYAVVSALIFAVVAIAHVMRLCCGCDGSWAWCDCISKVLHVLVPRPTEEEYRPLGRGAVT